MNRTPQRFETPLDRNLSTELISFWNDIFETNNAPLTTLLSGAECESNLDRVYIARDAHRLAGTTHLKVTQTGCRLGGLGEVAVAPEFRRQGIARQLVKLARDEFFDSDGEALFLATANPTAELLYRDLGWKFFDSSRVMCLTADSAAPGEFVNSYFEAIDRSDIHITSGTAAHRIPMIPLILAPHDSPILDINAALISTRVAVQMSCMGLYPRYESLRQNGSGDWFAVGDPLNRLVGLGSVRRHGDRSANIDWFTHERFRAHEIPLVARAIQWANEVGVDVIVADVATSDETKLETLRSLGFRSTKESAHRLPNGNLIPIQRFQRKDR